MRSAVSCIDENVLATYVRNSLDAAEATRVDDHIASCTDCRQLVFALGASETAKVPRSAGPGDRLGRYVVGKPLGSGSMGMVFAGRDPELGRNVALKVLRGNPTADGQARLLREARALAQLTHPNIVSVFDVGRTGDEVFLAMEHLDGRDLERWLAERKRSWREIQKLFVAAGSGLAAAHAIGVIHRDVKPQNLFVEWKGRVCVTDFGLARLEQTDDVPVALASVEASQRLTHGPVGTPAYMSPEQHAGATGDALSDQFSFCVSLYEALYGERPFRATTIEVLREQVLAGVVEPPRGRAVPVFIRDIVLRGLSKDPAARFASMDDLVRALARDPWVRRRRIGLGVAAVAAAPLFWLAVTGRSNDQLCKTSARKVSAIWNDDTRRAIRDAFFATSAPFVKETWLATEGALDRYAASWIATGDDACKATNVRGEQSAELLDLRMQCLGDQLGTVVELIDVLAHADRDVLAKALPLVQALPDTKWCGDAEALRAAAAPVDPAKRAQVDHVRAELSRASLLVDAGKSAEALVLAKQLVAEADALAFPPLRAEALVALGRVQRDMLDPKAAAVSLREGAMLADATRLDALRATALTELSVTTGDSLARLDEGRQLNRSAAAVVARLRDRDDLLAATETTAGTIEHKAGNYDLARAHFARALALEEQVRGPGTMQSANVVYNLATIEFAQHHHEKAEALVKRSLAIVEAAAGPAHPLLARHMGLLADVYWRMGKMDESIATHRRAVAIAERALGPDHGSLGWLLNNLAGVLGEADKTDEALPIQKRAVSIFEHTLGREHPDTAMALNGLGAIAYRTGDMKGALEAGLAALAIREKVLGPDHPRVSYDLQLVAAAYMGLDRIADAIPLIERVLAIRIKRDGDSIEVAATRLQLAMALYDVGRDRKRVLELTRQARAYISTSESAKASTTLASDLDKFMKQIGAN